MIKCVAIDDEPKALGIIKNHISKIDYLHLESVFTDPYKALKHINESNFELLFLDINMPDIDGISFIKHLVKRPLIIFTTAHSEYALESYEVEAIDYLLKPFDFSRFLVATNKAKERLLKSSTNASEFFFVNSGNQKVKLTYADILLVKGDGNYVTYQTNSKRVLVRSSITDCHDILPKNMFIQIHRSTIVSLKWIDKVEDYHVYIGENKFPISSTYRESFLKAIGTK